MTRSREAKGPCIRCRALIDSSAVRAHDSLQIYHVRVTAEGGIDYYRCRVCGAKLLREHRAGSPGHGWRLLEPPLGADE